MTAPPINLAGILDAAVEVAPDRLALVFDDGSSTSYGQLGDEVRAWAATLDAAGVGPGGRVPLCDWGGVRSAAATLAAAHLGAATTQMNPLLTARELRELIEVSGSGPVGVAGPDAAQPHPPNRRRQRAPRRPLPTPFHLAEALGPDATLLREPSGPVTADAAPPRVGQGDTAAVVLFTSGTTGRPKAIALSHAALLDRIQAYRQPPTAERPANVTLMCVPSFHVGGMLGLLVNLYGGDTTVIQPRFDAGGWLALVERHHVVTAFVVPAMLARILDHPDLAATDTSSLRMLSYGAAAAPVDLVRRAMEHWPDVGFANTFGQTETIGAYTTLSPVDHRDPRRIGSVGRPLAGVEIRLVDPDTGVETAADASGDRVGEIWVRSAQVVAPDQPPDGWMRSGDLARQDAHGYLYPLGRMSDTINRGGEKFPPSEIAERLRAHPAVADVVVVGVPDDELGQRVGVAVVVRSGHPTPTRDELRDWCRSDLAGFKLPDVVVFVDALPVNELGKLPRAAAVELITGTAADGPA